MRRLSEKERTTKEWFTAAAIVLTAALAATTPLLWAQFNLQGRWTTLPYLMPINPIHLAWRWPCDDFLRFDGDGRNEQYGRNLHGWIRLEPRVSGRMDAAALSAHAPDAQRQCFLLRFGHRLQDLQYNGEHVVCRRRNHELSQYSNVWNVGAAAVDSGQRISAPRHNFRRRQPRHGDHGNHRSGGVAAAVAIRTVDVSAPHRNERDDPAEWQSPGRRRIDE